MEQRISGHTGLLCLIGSPVGHSGSPAMFNYSFEKLGLDYVYVAFDVKAEEVPDVLKAYRTLGFKGGNVTMPCKIAAAQNVDELTPAAELIGAVNTIRNDNGKLIGHITDGVGFVLGLKDHGVDIKGKKITVAGTGGAATAIEIQCALDGAGEITILYHSNRDKARQTVEKLRKAAPECIVNVYPLSDTARVTAEIQSSDIFANSTLVGMAPMDDQSIITSPDAFHPDLVVMDAVYNPLETKLLKEARAAGCKTINGKSLLMWQGVAAFHFIMGQDMPVEEVRARFYK